MYKILIDSCGEFFPYMRDDGHFVSVPLTIDVDGYSIVDDDSFDQADFLHRAAESPNVPKSACPSPANYIEAMEGADRVYVITLSSQLSGSYNSAVLASNLYKEEHPSAAVHVFDSKSASIGQTLIGDHVYHMEQEGRDFEDIVKDTEAYIETQHTYFVLESLESLKKAGRLSGIKSLIASTLNIKPVMGSTPIGSIQQLDKGRGMRKALEKMADCMVADAGDTSDKILAISHCNCPDTAEVLKSMVSERGSYRDIIVVDTRGISYLYACDGGGIMVV